MDTKPPRRFDSKPLPASRGKRTLKSATIAARLAKEIISDRISSGGNNPTDGNLAAITRNARAIVESMGEMKGLITKLGQMLSYVDLDIPPDLRHVLTALQDSVPSMSEETVKQVLSAELGATPTEFF